MEKALRLCKDIINHIEKKNNRKNIQYELEQNKGCKLYHYTTLEGLVGIVSKDKNNKNGLWMSHARFLNDGGEIIESRKLILHLLKKGSEAIKLPNNDICKTIQFVENLNCDYFITCFSREKDSLEQWISYANHGKGVRLEITVDPLFTKNFNENTIIDFQDVIYDKKTYEDCIIKYTTNLESIKKKNLPQEFNIGLGKIGGACAGWMAGGILGAIVGGLIGSLFDSGERKEIISEIEQIALKYFPKGINEEESQKINNAFLLYMLPKMKKTGFEFEQEVRLILFNNEIDKKYRVINNIICPYIDIRDLVKNKFQLNITEIMIGPAANFNQTKESILYLMQNNGYKEFTMKNIKKSIHNFRG